MKAVLVDWRDACQGPHGWHALEDAGKEEMLVVRSIGWLIAEHEDRIVIACAIYDESCSDVNVIPLASVIGMRVIEL